MVRTVKLKTLYFEHLNHVAHNVCVEEFCCNISMHKNDNFALIGIGFTFRNKNIFQIM